MVKKSPNMRGCSSGWFESPRRRNYEICVLLLGSMGCRWLPGKRKIAWLIFTQTGILHIAETLQFLFGPQEVDVNTLFIDKVSLRVCGCVFSCSSHVQLCATPWTVAHQAPLSMGFPQSGLNSGVGCQVLHQEFFRTQGLSRHLLHSCCNGEGFFSTESPWKPLWGYTPFHLD